MRVVILILCFLLSFSGIAQVEAAEYGRGSLLMLSGAFIGADTVFIEVYHGVETSAKMTKINGYTIELVQHDHYTIKFTDTKGRTKIMFIPCVGQDVIESVGVDVDFRKVGDLVLLKENARREGFDLLDAGLQRKRKE